MVYKERRRYFKIFVKKGRDLLLDEEEFRVVVQAIDRKQEVVKCRDGIVFTSNIWEVVLDEEIMSRIDGEISMYGHFDDRLFYPEKDSLDKVLENKKQLANGG